jgi:hypothetical protein
MRSWWNRGRNCLSADRIIKSKGMRVSKVESQKIKYRRHLGLNPHSALETFEPKKSAPSVHFEQRVK